MADDGMLINFDVGKSPFQARPSFKGGSWKDRLSAKRATAHGRQKQSGGIDAPNGSIADRAETGKVVGQVEIAQKERTFAEAAPRPAKRQKVGSGLSVNRYRSDTAAVKGGATSNYHASHDHRPKQVVSSLFSFNPQTKSAPEKQQRAEDQASAEASNAPLKDELHTFTSLGLSGRLAEHLLRKMDLKAPTSIQKEAITQLIKEDTDAFLQAETGSGKTLAYLLPIVQRIMNLSMSGKTKINRDSGLFAIILAPTRELSKQISVVLEKLLRAMNWIVSGTVVGGENKKSEKERLRHGLNILIATPGRLVDHLEHTKSLDVSSVRWLVLDEGDRLMELGFEKDLQKIVSILNLRARGMTSTIPTLPGQRTTVLCSATMKMDVQKLGEISLKDAVHIKAMVGNLSKLDATTDVRFSAPAQLQQSYAIVPAKLRLVSLQALLKRTFARKGSVMKTIVFMSCADSVNFHFKVFARQGADTTDGGGSTVDDDDSVLEDRTGAPTPGLSAKDISVQVFRLHGSLPQAVRTSTLAAYRTCKNPAILICTDVASRGLDLPNVDFVVEYDPPFSRDDHLHRIGRTARAGKDGRAMIFLMPGTEEEYVQILKDERHDSCRDLASHDSIELLRKGFGSTGLGGDKEWEQRATDWQLDVERWTLENPPRLELARRAFQSHVRAYATHVAPERHMFDMTALHLGHLAKAFGLRDKPGSIRVPGLRPSKSATNMNKAERKAKAGKAARTGTEDMGRDPGRDADTHEGFRKMRAKAKMQMGGSSEFNLG